MERYVTADLSGWLPDRSPTWAEVLFVIFIGLQTPMFLEQNDQLSALAVGFGFVVTIVAMGPVAHSSVGEVVDRWFRAIGKGGRATVIVAYAVGLWITMAIVEVPVEVIQAGFGSLLAVAAFMVAHLLTARMVSGWTPPEAPDEET